LLDEIDLGPDALSRKVEEFKSISHATEHSYPALVMSGEDSIAVTQSQHSKMILLVETLWRCVYSDDEYILW